MPISQLASLPSTHPIELGFVPLVDAAPLIVAKEFGLFAEEGLKVELVREPGWATVRDKLVLGRELDGAHALAGLAFATTYGIGCIAHHCLTGYVMNRHGNGVTLSRELWDDGVRTPAELPAWLSKNSGRSLRLGNVHNASTHHFLLRSMLGRCGLRIDEHVEIVVLPPELMADSLQRGKLDGFCAGEPWNSVAIEAGSGFCAATSAELCSGHPEKVFLVPSEFAERRPEEHLAIIRSLSAAGKLCDAPETRKEIIRLLASPAYLDLPPEIIANSLSKTFHRGFEQYAEGSSIHSFSGDDVNSPTVEKSNLVLGQLRDCGLIKGPRPRHPAPDKIFRNDLYKTATATTPSSPGKTAAAEVTTPIH